MAAGISNDRDGKGIGEVTGYLCACGIEVFLFKDGMNQAWKQGVGFIGAGAVGSTLAIALHELGYKVSAVASKSGTSAQRLAKQMPGCFPATPQEVADDCAAVFLAVPDDSLKEVVAQIRWHGNQDVVHCSGSAPVALLAPAQQAGAAIGGFHPLQTFPRRDLPPRVFQGVQFGVQADGDLRSRLTALATELGGQALLLKDEDRALYHASAVLVCGAVAALADAATGMWGKLSAPEEKKSALLALLPLLRSTIDGLAREGLPNALTGPVARGDIGTVRAHLDALRKQAPDIAALYASVGLAQVPVARAKGTCAPKSAMELEQLFRSELGRGR